MHPSLLYSFVKLSSSVPNSSVHLHQSPPRRVPSKNTLMLKSVLKSVWYLELSIKCVINESPYLLSLTSIYSGGHGLGISESLIKAQSQPNNS